MQNNDEIQKFEKFGHNWWNTDGGEFKMLHRINPLRIQFIKKHIIEHLKKELKLYV